MGRTRKRGHKKEKRRRTAGKRRTAVKRGGGWFSSFFKSDEEKMLEALEKMRAEKAMLNQQKAEEKKQQARAAFPFLMEAIKTGDEVTVKGMLGSNPDINKKDENQFAPLHYAVIYGNQAIFNALISYASQTRHVSNASSIQKVNVDIEDKDFQTPLLLAYLYKQYDNAKVLIKQLFANINKKDQNGDNLLIKLIKRITDGSDIPITVEMVKQMLKDGADLHMENKQGLSAIKYVEALLNAEQSDGSSLSDEDRELLHKIHDALLNAISDEQDRRAAMNMHLWHSPLPQKIMPRRRT